MKPISRQTLFYTARLVGCVLLACGLDQTPAQADPLPPMKSPVAFFTNVAARLLLDAGLPALDHIQLWPTNQYTPAVHRLLQLTANLCDARAPGRDSAPGFPTVFRPTFTNTGTEVFISGYVEETGTGVLAAPFRDLSADSERASLQPMDLVQGIPLVIGARKGFPNFNEFTLQTIVQIQRKLELRRPTSYSFPNETNQLYYLSVSNLFGLEAWNSYATTYPRPLEMRAFIALTWTLTNEVGMLWRTNYTFPGGQTWYTFPTIASNGWAAAKLSLGGAYADGYTNSLRVPVSGGLTVQTNSAYVQGAAGGGFLADVHALFPRTGTYPVPKLWLTISARVRYALVDLVENRVVDFVNLDRLDRTVALSDWWSSPAWAWQPWVAAQPWRTNRIGGSTVSHPTEGILAQLQASLGNFETSLSDWKDYGGNSGNTRDKERAIDAFRAFFHLIPISVPGQANPPVVTNLVMQAPFNPIRKLSFTASWQANDPLVHYLPSDLSNLLSTNEVELVTPPLAPPSWLLPNLGRMNPRTLPWGGNAAQFRDTNQFALALKDPLIRRSDDWDFPTNAPLNLATLSRVHRGTPWQTVSLKSTNVSFGDWKLWTGMADNREAALTLPTRDWHLAELWLAWTQTRYDMLLSVNERDPARWLLAFDGIEVLTNNLSDPAFYNPYQEPQFASLTMTADSAQSSVLAQAIANRRRASPDGVFHSLAELLAVPELSSASPWLNVSPTQLQRGLTDAAYEAIPVQLLPRLRPDLLRIEHTSGGMLRLTVGGFPGATCVIETSADLRQWRPVSTNRLADGTFTLDYARSDDASEFFRSRTLP